LPIQVQEASRISKKLDQNRTSPWYIIIKTTSTETRERILKAIREEKANNIDLNPSKSQQISQWKP
jgi:ribosomal protein L39E